MIIEQIKMKNWLSYPDKWELAGQYNTPCLQFNEEPVSLIFGKNGSGKSSIMEAILFALFGEYSRSSGRQDILQASAIHTGQTSASIELVFNLNGQRHKVQRILNQRSSSTAKYFLWRANKNEWEVNLSQVKEVNDKIVSLLGIERELFSGTVILEQGKTGRFMELKPSEQVNHVINLLGLNAYARYHQKAKELANDCQRRVKETEDALTTLADASLQKVESAQDDSSQLQEALNNTNSEMQRLILLLEQVKAIQGLLNQVEHVKAQISDFSLRIQQKDAILNADKTIHEWSQIEPKLGTVQNAVKHYGEYQTRIERLNDELETARTDYASQNISISELTPQHKQAQELKTKRDGELEELQDDYAEKKKQRDLIKTELELDHREKVIIDEQIGREAQLAQWDQIEASYHLRDELRKAEGELKEIVRKLRDSTAILAEIRDSKRFLGEQEETLKIRQEKLPSLIEEEETLSGQLEEARNEKTRIDGEWQANKAMLSKREEAHGKSTCPTCGTTLENQELDRFHRELQDLQKMVEEGKNALASAKQQVTSLEGQLGDHRKISGREEQEIAGEKSRIANVKQSLVQKEKDANKQKEETQQQWRSLVGSLVYAVDIISSPTEECLHQVREQLTQLKDAADNYVKLQRVQGDFENAQAELKRINDQRRHPAQTFGETQLSEINQIISDLEGSITLARGELRNAEQDERELFEQLTEAQGQIRMLTQQIQKNVQESLPREIKNLERAETEKQEAHRHFEASLTELDWPPQILDALQEASMGKDAVKQTILDWLNSYRPLAKQLQDLQTAEREIRGLQTRQGTLEDQIHGYSDEAQKTSVKTVENLLQDIEVSKKQLTPKVKAAQRLAWEEEQRLEKKLKLEANHKQLVKDEKHFRNLAKLLEPPGRNSLGGPLLQEIMRGALQEVTGIASDILEEWGQSTEVIVPEDTLEFKVIDRSGGYSERAYQLFSGGEKFMVALAMALAIGEVAGGTGQMDCLFIDEGFGLLDSDNRTTVAQEIVSNLVRSGRRRQVIVITHMEDIKSAFPKQARYHLVNDGNGTKLFAGDDNADS